MNITSEHESVVKSQIKESWERIHAHDFYTGCGKPDCDWCNFVKDHKLYTALKEAEVETEFELPTLRLAESD